MTPTQGQGRKRVVALRCVSCGAAVTKRVIGAFRPDRQCRRCGKIGTVRMRAMSVRKHRRLRRRRAADNAVGLTSGPLRQKIAALLSEIARLSGVERRTGNTARGHVKRRASRLRRVVTRMFAAGRGGKARKERSPWR